MTEKKKTGYRRVRPRWVRAAVLGPGQTAVAWQCRQLGAESLTASRLSVASQNVGVALVVGAAVSAAAVGLAGARAALVNRGTLAPALDSDDGLGRADGNHGLATGRLINESRGHLAFGLEFALFDTISSGSLNQVDVEVKAGSIVKLAVGREGQLVASGSGVEVELEGSSVAGLNLRRSSRDSGDGSQNGSQRELHFE